MPMFNDSGLHRAIVFFAVWFGPLFLVTLFTKNQTAFEIAFWFGTILAGVYSIAQLYQIMKSGK